jgi:hypothetical protein
MQNVILTEADFKDQTDGYHYDVWADICETLNLDPLTTDTVTLRLSSFEVKE